MRTLNRSSVLTLAAGMTFGFCLAYIFHSVSFPGGSHLFKPYVFLRLASLLSPLLYRLENLDLHIVSIDCFDIAQILAAKISRGPRRRCPWARTRSGGRSQRRGYGIYIFNI